MKTSKLVALAVALLAGALVLTGCLGESTQSSTENENSTKNAANADNGGGAQDANGTQTGRIQNESGGQNSSTTEGASNQDASSQNADSARSVETNKNVAITVDSVSDWTKGQYDSNPAPGNKYILLSMSIENKMNEDLKLNPNYFELDTSEGQVHTYSWTVDYTMPEGVQPRSTINTTLGFEVGITATPTRLHFDNYNLETVTLLPGVPADTPHPSGVNGLPAVVMNVSEVTDWAKGQYDPSPDPGNKYILLTIAIQNNLGETLNLNPNYFKLDTSDGQVHTYSWTVDYNMPQGVHAGSNITATLGFEVSTAASLTALHFDNYDQEVEVSL